MEGDDVFNYYAVIASYLFYGTLLKFYKRGKKYTIYILYKTYRF